MRGEREEGQTRTSRRALAGAGVRVLVYYVFLPWFIGGFLVRIFLRHEGPVALVFKKARASNNMAERSALFIYPNQIST